MSEIITARLALRPVTADEVAAVLGGRPPLLATLPGQPSLAPVDSSRVAG